LLDKAAARKNVAASLYVAQISRETGNALPIALSLHDHKQTSIPVKSARAASLFPLAEVLYENFEIHPHSFGLLGRGCRYIGEPSLCDMHRPGARFNAES